MTKPKKLELIFGDVAMTFTPDDIEAVWREWEAKNPGKRADRDMKPDEFSKACLDRMMANARPTRTILHN